MWPPPPVGYLTKEDGKTQASSHLSLLKLPRGKHIKTLPLYINSFITSKRMQGMNQTEAEYPRHNKRSQTASLRQIGPLVLEI